ncbi:MAG: hypothetical protein ACTSV3_05035 [Candidatus Thorarchaeota archaeon]
MSKWMYVDIVERNESLEVVSSLMQTPYSIKGAISESERCLRASRAMVRQVQASLDEFSKSFASLKDLLIERSENFPEHPEWD